MLSSIVSEAIQVCVIAKDDLQSLNQETKDSNFEKRTSPSVSLTVYDVVHASYFLSFFLFYVL